MKKTILLTLAIPIFLLTHVMAQSFTVTPCQTNEDVIQLVDSVLLGNILSGNKSNITFTGDPASVGYYKNGYFLGFEHNTGMIITTGLADAVNNTNTCNSDANASTDNNGTENEPDLSILGNGAVHDASIVEFDVYLKADSMSLNYVFASEEYNDYVTSEFNDVFGFFLSGEGIQGNYSNNAALLNTVPGSTQFVSVHSINFGQGGKTCTGKPSGCNNCQCLIDNSETSDPAFYQMVYDAYTTPLTGTHYVTPFKWYHIKLSISDIADAVFDSGIFLEKNFLIQYNATGIDKSLTSPLKVYPNPVRNILHVETGTGTSKVKLDDMHGNRLLQKSSSDNTLNIDVSNLHSGIYILTVTTNSYTGHRKIIVK